MALIAYFRASDEPQIKGSVIKAIIAGVVAFLIFILGGGAMMAGMLSQMKGGSPMHFSSLGDSGRRFLVLV